MYQLIHAPTILVVPTKRQEQVLSAIKHHKLHWFFDSTMQLFQLDNSHLTQHSRAFTVPDGSSSCNITLLYKSTGRLLHIDCTWNSVSVSHIRSLVSTLNFLANVYIECFIWHCSSFTRGERKTGEDKEKLFTSFQDPLDPGEACPGPSGNITQYQIRFQTGSSVYTQSVGPSECTAGICGYIYRPASNLLNDSVSSSYDNVSVIAKNVVGVGTARTCTTQPISELNLGLYNVEVLCIISS